MTLWWIGNVVVIVAVVPLLVFLLRGVHQATQEIQEYVADALEHGVLAIAALDAVDELEETLTIVQRLTPRARRYAGAVAKLL